MSAEAFGESLLGEVKEESLDEVWRIWRALQQSQRFK